MEKTKAINSYRSTIGTFYKKTCWKHSFIKRNLNKKDLKSFNENLLSIDSFMTEVLIIQKVVHWFAQQIWLLYDRDLCHERVKLTFHKLVENVLVIVQFGVQYGQYFPIFSYSTDLFPESLVRTLAK